ncbi:MAG: aminotransferase class III-fold pyridoxal phosphate-dependent enzyme, partial [Gloeomargaritaceae cyanobacterium C42_A2020_066]|nr:aminotransferase class III-fold pyridoxal phosphate-dependent enzyme [Gloeomargaritaceae cyanobacterium C42_A2020_066]
NPLACATALRVCETVAAHDLPAQAQRCGERLQAGLWDIQQRYPDWFAEARGWGLLQGLVLRQDSSLSAPQIVKAAIEQGLLLVPAGPQVVRFVPPLIVTEAEIDQALDRLSQALATQP